LKAAQCLPLSPRWQQPLKRFLEALQQAGDDRLFQPHPFTDEALEHLARYQGKDVYCVLVKEERVVGYGLLRGWDEGYEVPSLGIAIHPQSRHEGLGTELMRWLHATALERGASRVRLRVMEHNAEARKLYERLGYRFDVREGEYLVGTLDL
jgi:[ribosomal protein S18]-alanine N-acetyltransferase